MRIDLQGRITGLNKLQNNRHTTSSNAQHSEYQFNVQIKYHKIIWTGVTTNFEKFLQNRRFFIDPNFKIEPIIKEIGYEIKINDEIVIKGDYKSLLRHDGDSTIFQVDIEKSYTLKILDSHYIEFNELPNFWLDLNWYEKDIDASLIQTSWREYANKIDLNKIMSFLIYRDTKILQECINSGGRKYPLISPSWDVCVLLPYYLKICENIPGHEIKLKRATEVIRQINNLIKSFYKRLRRGENCIPLRDLDDLLKKVHSQSDELAVAHKLSKLGFDIRFGNPKTEPDFMVNGLRVEHKSRFPHRILSNDTVFTMNFTSIEESETLHDLAKQLTSPTEWLEKKDPDIFINNITRMPIANKFYGLSFKGLRHYPDINLFYNVVSDAIKLAENEKVIIPYIYPICSNPRIISFPITLNAYKLRLNRKI